MGVYEKRYLHGAIFFRVTILCDSERVARCHREKEKHSSIKRKHQQRRINEVFLAKY